jgi:hypothetical protein
MSPGLPAEAERKSERRHFGRKAARKTNYMRAG